MPKFGPSPKPLLKAKFRNLTGLSLSERTFAEIKAVIAFLSLSNIEFALLRLKIKNDSRVERANFYVVFLLTKFLEWARNQTREKSYFPGLFVKCFYSLEI